jgi:HAD superfamily hydrolase (TIGR01509 family)
VSPGERTSAERSGAPSSVAAVIFDLDGVLIDSEQGWAAAREELVREQGGKWRVDATREMMGMSSPEWSRYMHDVLGVPMAPEKIAEEVVDRLQALHREHLPLLPGAREAVTSLASHWPLGLASSANRPIVEQVLDLAGLRRLFAATVSAEEVARGKPAPDVYIEAAARLRVIPSECVAVEDSTNGLRAAAAAGMRVIAVPNREYPPDESALALADAVVRTPGEIGPQLVAGLGSPAERGGGRAWERPADRSI